MHATLHVYIYPVRTNVRLERTGILAANAAFRGLLGIVVANIVLFLLARLGMRAIEIGQYLVGREMDIVDAVTVNLDARVQGARGLGKVDAARNDVIVCCRGVVAFVVQGIRVLAALVETRSIRIRIRLCIRLCTSIVTIVTIIIIIVVHEKLVNVFNETKVPTIRGIDAILSVHANGFFVEFAQVRLGICCGIVWTVVVIVVVVIFVKGG
jgi:hypothetical protein